MPGDPNSSCDTVCIGAKGTCVSQNTLLSYPGASSPIVLYTCPVVPATIMRQLLSEFPGIFIASSSCECGPGVSNGTPPIAPSYTCIGVRDPGGLGTLYSGEGTATCTWKVPGACPAGYRNPDGSGYCYDSGPAKPTQKTCDGVSNPAGPGGIFHAQTVSSCIWKKKVTASGTCPTKYRNPDDSGYCFDDAPIKVPTCVGLDPHGSNIVHAGEGTSNCIWRIRITSCPTGYGNLDSGGYCYDTAPAKNK